ncbi:MAG: long-chain fatty acid--CoA ligase [Symploca sp. SIO2E9]|nr:long-chain fatty acid--CoA ligase [Symploca sp. SIO2E9]
MFWPNKIYTAPPNSAEVILGRTLPSLLDEACVRYPNHNAFQQPTAQGWQSLSNLEFRSAAEELALGLLDLELEKSTRICLFMHSDVNFCIADMGCLLAKLIDVPIYPAEAPENIIFIIEHSEAKALIISNPELLEQVAPYLWKVPNLKIVIVAEVTLNWQQQLPPLPPQIQVFSISEVRSRGKAQLSPTKQQQLRSEIAPNDLATIIYIAGGAGESEKWRRKNSQFKFTNAIRQRVHNLKQVNDFGANLQGVMLTHENISADILAAFSNHPQLEPGLPEVVLSFLPLTHIFARAFVYGHINYGHSIYFTTPERVAKHLREVQPTLFVTVPRLLEKTYENILKKGRQLKGFDKIVFNWALNLAKRYELGQKPVGSYALQLKLANRIVFSSWRKAFGGHLKALLSGGAALRADLANIFSAAGITVLQGYGLTETSSVLCYNRGEFNRAGTVGIPITGVEMAIAEDGEILVKAPYIMKGYYKNPEATQQVIEPSGWFHTGDLGEFTAEGFLKIIGCKKNLFKLSTGKYVTPQPLENKLQQSPLVKQAIAVGADRKFCSMLIFPEVKNLRTHAKILGIELPIEELLKHPKIISIYQKLVDKANKKLPQWSAVKRFKLINSSLTVENGMLSSSLKVKRAKVSEVFATVIDSMYAESKRRAVLSFMVGIFNILYLYELYKLVEI